MTDSHCHIHLNNAEFEQIAHRAEKAGVKNILNIFDLSKEEDFLKMEAVLALQSPVFRVLAAIGVHPLETESISITTAQKIIETNQNKVSAFGETGMDLFKASNFQTQLDFLSMHCAMARAHKKPVIIHQRNCKIEDILAIVDSFAVKAIFHCWSSDTKSLEKALQSNCSISFSGLVTFDKSMQIIETCQICPLTSLLLETDSPFLAPVPFRGKTNEPAYLRQIYEFVADLKKITFEELRLSVDKNFHEIFK